MSLRPSNRVDSLKTTSVSTAPCKNGRMNAVLAVGLRGVNMYPSVETGPKHGRDAGDEEIVYVLGKRTMKSMPMVLDVLSSVLYWAMHEEDPEDDSSEQEVYLLNELRDSGRHLDINKILKLLENEANHLKVMAALAVMTNYDVDLTETTRELEAEELAEFERVWALLPRWARAADEPAAKKASA